jgi:hypothetical protein
MSGPSGYPSDEQPGLLKSLLRWAVAAAVATLVTLVLFTVMTRLIDGTWILEGLIRVFPLSTAQVTPEDECAIDEATARPAVSIAGEVGYYANGSFVPLPDARIQGDDGARPPHPVEVAADGAFRFVTAFPDETPSPCRYDGEKPPAETQWLIVGAEGCSERRVPVTRAWVSHRVLIPCRDRG